MMTGQVCLVSREMEGIAGAGGLKDVVRGLADALMREGFSTTVILPRYGFVSRGNHLYTFSITAGGQQHQVHIDEMELGGIRLLLVDNPLFSEKFGVYTYTEKDAGFGKDIGIGHHDALLMNVLFQASAVMAMIHDKMAPDIIHGHDGHCGLIPLYMRKYSAGSRFFDRTGFLLTIHNAGAAYQQSMGNIAEASVLTGLSEEVLKEGLVEDSVNPILLAGKSGHLNTVSPGYAREIRTGRDLYSGALPAQLKKSRIRLRGVVNGIDPDQWTAPVLEYLPSLSKPGKSELRKKLVEDLSLSRFKGVSIEGSGLNADSVWVLFHGRLTEQKGLEELLSLGVPGTASEGYQLIIYGQGETGEEVKISEYAEAAKDRIFLRGYDADLTPLIIAASTFVIVPSLWEPCGQIDMVGQILGALPIVRRVGGLKKIHNCRDGFSYPAEGFRLLEKTLVKALRMNRKNTRTVSRMRKRAENTIYGRRSWRKVLIRGYLPLYRNSAKIIRH